MHIIGLTIKKWQKANGANYNQALSGEKFKETQEFGSEICRHVNATVSNRRKPLVQNISTIDTCP